MSDNNSQTPNPNSEEPQTLTLEVNKDDPNYEYVSKLLGEGGKYKSVGELAKGYSNADTHIKNVEGGYTELLNELDKRETLQDLLKKHQDGTQPETAPQTAKTDNGGDDGGKQAQVQQPDDPKDDLPSLVRQELERANTERQSKENEDSVLKVLQAKYGDAGKIREVLQQKSDELGISADMLAETARKSPKAFYSLTGIEAPAQKKTSSFWGQNQDVSTDSRVSQRPSNDPNNPAPNTKAYFDKLRATDKRKYFSQEVQAAMHKAAMENPNFFGE